MVAFSTLYPSAHNQSRRSGCRCRWPRTQHIVDGVDVDQVAVELYRLTPGEFTAARNTAAKRAMDAGDAGDHTIADLAELFTVSRPTVYRVLERRQHR
jgi:hypothetical protein